MFTHLSRIQQDLFHELKKVLMYVGCQVSIVLLYNNLLETFDVG